MPFVWVSKVVGCCSTEKNASFLPSTHYIFRAELSPFRCANSEHASGLWYKPYLMVLRYQILVLFLIVLDLQVVWPWQVPLAGAKTSLRKSNLGTCVLVALNNYRLNSDVIKMFLRWFPNKFRIERNPWAEWKIQNYSDRMRSTCE